MDTIVAIATPRGRGGVGVIRISGPLVLKIADSLLSIESLQPRYAHWCPFLDEQGAILDRGLALYFPGPHSFTGEDVLELQAHGSPILLDLLIRHTLLLGARIARPGEFSERAFLNRKMDLVQAEAIADLINAETELAARCAQKVVEGALSRELDQLLDALLYLRMFMEAAIDFSDEEIDFLSDEGYGEKLHEVIEQLNQIIASAKQGSILREGMNLLILGRPNAGKSSLLNRLSRKDRAIVSEWEGTTRDLLKEEIDLDGIPLHIIDTAGLRDTQDPIEQEGIRRALQAAESSDHILLLMDATKREEADLGLLSNLPPERSVTRVMNKIDLAGEHPRIQSDDSGQTIIWLSAKTGAGMDLLMDHLKRSAGLGETTETTFLSRRRHIDALEKTRDASLDAQSNLKSGRLECVAEDLRQAHQALGEITGQMSSDELLGQIFSNFCIGK